MIFTGVKQTVSFRNRSKLFRILWKLIGTSFHHQRMKNHGLWIHPVYWDVLLVLSNDWWVTGWFHLSTNFHDIPGEPEFGNFGSFLGHNISFTFFHKNLRSPEIMRCWFYGHGSIHPCMPAISWKKKRGISGVTSEENGFHNWIIGRI